MKFDPDETSELSEMDARRLQREFDAKERAERVVDAVLAVVLILGMAGLVACLIYLIR